MALARLNSNSIYILVAIGVTGLKLYHSPRIFSQQPSNHNPVTNKINT